MKMTKNLAAFLVCALLSFSASNAFAAKETRADYISYAERQFTQYENEVAQMINERNTLAKDSQRYKDLNAKIDDMSEHVKEGREYLRELREDLSAQWEPRRKAVESQLTELRKLSEAKHRG